MRRVRLGDMRWHKRLLFFGLWLGLSGMAQAGPIRILKVLPHFLDLEGRSSLSPSLYERDAYQAQLRRNPELRSALRFDVQWKARGVDPTRLKMRLELRGSKSHAEDPYVLEQAVKPRAWFSQWSAATLPAKTYEQLGDIIGWRVTLWEGDQCLAEQKSFLWPSQHSASGSLPLDSKPQ